MVASPSITIVFVNPIIDLVLIPSCPAASATPAIPSTDSGISFAMPRIAVFNCASSPLVASTVFFTPVNALSKLIPLFIDAAVPAATATTDVFAAVLINDFILPAAPVQCFSVCFALCFACSSVLLYSLRCSSCDCLVLREELPLDCFVDCSTSFAVRFADSPIAFSVCFAEASTAFFELLKSFSKPELSSPVSMITFPSAIHTPHIKIVKISKKLLAI